MKKIKNFQDVKEKIYQTLSETDKPTEVASLGKTALQMERFKFEQDSHGELTRMAAELFRLMGVNQDEIISRNKKPALKVKEEGDE